MCRLVDSGGRLKCPPCASEVVRRALEVAIDCGSQEVVIFVAELLDEHSKVGDLFFELCALSTARQVVMGVSRRHLVAHRPRLGADAKVLLNYSDSSPASVPPGTNASSACTISSWRSALLGWSFGSIGINSVASAAAAVPTPSIVKPCT